MISRANYSIDMCHGPLLGKIVRFVIPLMAANMMQCLFSAVDLIVIGRYASADAMAAVGSSGPLISAILSVFFGLSVGGNVLVARYIGAEEEVQPAPHGRPVCFGFANARAANRHRRRRRRGDFPSSRR